MKTTKSQQKRPLSPSQLFSKLMAQNYKNSECEDSQQKFKQQKAIILQLILEYEASIKKALITLDQEGRLLHVREQLVAELESTKMERQIIQQEISSELNRLRIRQTQTRQKQKLSVQLKEIRCINSKLKFKLRDLCDYVEKLQAHNAKLEQERRIISSNTAHRMRISEQDWREKIQKLRRNQEIYECEMKSRLDEKQLMREEHIRKQEEQIMDHNRRAFNNAKARSYTEVPILPSVINHRIPQRNFSRFRVI